MALGQARLVAIVSTRVLCTICTDRGDGIRGVEFGTIESHRFSAGLGHGEGVEKNRGACGANSQGKKQNQG
jgi:hypothetical protein